MAEDRDDDSFGGAYEDGHWQWDDAENSLIFVLDNPPLVEETVLIAPKLVVSGAVEFKELDLIEQMRFRKRYQRKLKSGEPDIITLQDVKDLAIYTAPLSILSPMVISMLHTPTTERFLRALIVYCQYYLQIAQKMSDRMAALETRIRTPTTLEVEEQFREDLCDLRALVAKEFSTVLIGGHDLKNYHHMGSDKKKKSLSDKDARFIESLLVMFTQIVWLTLGRRSFNQLELEINRIFKTEIFNSVEHRLKTKYIAKMTPEERKVLLGNCLRHDAKLKTSSPLLNEIFCPRPIDYRMMGIGVIKYEGLSPRLRYLQLSLICPEADLETLEVILGILGRPRSCFDTALYLLPSVKTETKGGKSAASSMTARSNKSTGGEGERESASSLKSSVGSLKKSGTIKLYGYNDIILPVKDYVGERVSSFPLTFPDESQRIRPSNEKQRKLWMLRLRRLTHASLMRKSRKSILHDQ